MSHLTINRFNDRLRNAVDVTLEANLAMDKYAAGDGSALLKFDTSDIKIVIDSLEEFTPVIRNIGSTEDAVILDQTVKNLKILKMAFDQYPKDPFDLLKPKDDEASDPPPETNEPV